MMKPRSAVCWHGSWNWKLELEGNEVCQAGDCKSALKQLELHAPDVALCDPAILRIKMK